MFLCLLIKKLHESTKTCMCFHVFSLIQVLIDHISGTFSAYGTGGTGLWSYRMPRS